MLSVGVQITVSHRVRKIQNIIRAFDIDKNSISAQIFLFSVLFMLEKNIHKHIQEANKSHTKWKLKFCGLIIASKLDTELGMKFQLSSEKAM